MKERIKAANAAWESENDPGVLKKFEEIVGNDSGVPKIWKPQKLSVTNSELTKTPFITLLL